MLGNTQDMLLPNLLSGHWALGMGHWLFPSFPHFHALFPMPYAPVPKDYFQSIGDIRSFA